MYNGSCMIWKMGGGIPRSKDKSYCVCAVIMSMLKLQVFSHDLLTLFMACTLNIFFTSSGYKKTNLKKIGLSWLVTFHWFYPYGTWCTCVIFVCSDPLHCTVLRIFLYFRWLIFSFSVIVFIVEKMGAEVELIEEYSHYLAYISFVSSEQFMIIVGGHYFFREDLMKVIKEGGGKIGGVFGMRLSDDLRVKKITMHTRFKRETPTRPPTALQKTCKK